MSENVENSSLPVMLARTGPRAVGQKSKRRCLSLESSFMISWRLTDFDIPSNLRIRKPLKSGSFKDAKTPLLYRFKGFEIGGSLGILMVRLHDYPKISSVDGIGSRKIPLWERVAGFFWAFRIFILIARFSLIHYKMRPLANRY